MCLPTCEGFRRTFRQAVFTTGSAFLQDFQQLLRPGISLVRNDGRAGTLDTRESFGAAFGFGPELFPEYQALAGAMPPYLLAATKRRSNPPVSGGRPSKTRRSCTCLQPIRTLTLCLTRHARRRCCGQYRGRAKHR